MKFILIAIGIAATLLGGCAGLPRGYEPREGDVLFQSLPHSPLVDTIEAATHSSYSHCGIVVSRNGRWMVLEAIGPVKETTLAAWVRQSRDGAFDAYRFDESLTPAIGEIVACAERYRGRPYDIHYSFDNQAIYCSELIFVAVREATGRTVGKVVRLGDLDWQSHADFIRSIEGRIPLEREMITPVDLSRAPELRLVFRRSSVDPG